jgi:pimeloyl-ACP methyl ester carboxylesterase
VHGIWGELDALYKGKMHLLPERLTGCNLQSFQTIPNAGHWVQYEQADAFNRALQQCLTNAQHREELDQDTSETP